MKRGIKVSIVIISIAFVIFLLQRYVVRPWSPNNARIEGFYMEPEESLDAVLIGASDLYYDFSACQAYMEYGYTSYPFACDENTVGLWRTQADEIMRTQKPDVIVVEINGALHMDEPVRSEHNLRFFTDNMPYGSNLDSLLKRYDGIYHPADKISYYLPYFKYHENLFPLGKILGKTIDRLSFEGQGYSYLKGGITKLHVAERSEHLDMTDDDRTAPLEQEHEAYLRDFAQHCAENAYPVIFVRAPHRIEPGDEKNAMRVELSNRVAEIVGEYGYEFIHFDRMHGELGLDEDKDFTSKEHLNYFGQQKFTRKLSELLLQKGMLKKKEHPQEVVQKWDCCVRYYKQWVQDAAEEWESRDGEETGFYFYESADLIRKLTKELAG